MPREGLSSGRLEFDPTKQPGAQEGIAGRRLRACPSRRPQKRKGEFSCENSPPLFRFSEIWFGFQITTLVTPESFGTYELTSAFTSLFYDYTRCKSLPTAVRPQLPGSSLLTILEDDC